MIDDSQSVPSKAQPICQTTVAGQMGCTQTLQVLLQTSVATQVESVEQLLSERANTTRIGAKTLSK